MHDLVQAYEVLHSVLVPRGLYAETNLMLMVNLRRPSELRDVVVELVVRGRAIGSPVWRVAEGLRVPGRMKLRSVSSVLYGLMLRAAYDIEAQISLPGEDRPQRPGGARFRSCGRAGRAACVEERDGRTTVCDVSLGGGGLWLFNRFLTQPDSLCVCAPGWATM